MNDELEVDLALAALREEPEPVLAMDQRARLLERLEASVALPPDAAKLPADPATPALGATAPVAQATAIALAFSVGAALGVGAMALFQSSSERLVFVPANVPVASVSPAASAPPSAAADTTAASPPPALPSVDLRPMPVPPAPSERTPSKPARGDQQELLDRARGELAAGKGGAALSSLELHRRRFPTTWLEEERQALSVRALLAVGRRAEAGRAYHTFQRRFPRSPLLASLRAMFPEESVTEAADERQ